MEVFWLVFILSSLAGLIQCIDDPARDGDEIKVEVDTSTLDIHNLNSIFNALKAYGPTKKPDDQKAASQYVSVIVLAEEEIRDIGWLRNGQQLEFPDNYKTNDRRIRVQYNEESNKVHGEKIILERYLGGLIEEMQRDSKAKRLNTYPVVILYSYYIPCSMTSHVCAQRLAYDKRNRETKYSLVVGYSEYYIYKKRHNNPKDLTIKNIQDSVDTLREGAIAVYYMVQDFSKQLFVIVQKDTFSDIFQTNLYDCLIKQPLTYSCSTNLDNDPQDAVDGVSRIVTFSINTMVYKCKSDLSNTQVLTQKLKMCYDKWMDTNIGSDCKTSAGSMFGQLELIFYKKCFSQTCAFSKFVGALKDWDHLDYPSWEHAPILSTWPVEPAEFLKNNALKCYDRSLRPDSFCTITENPQAGESEPRERKRTREGEFVVRGRNTQG